MSTILVRCSVHPELSHEAFADWLDRRRRGLTAEASGVRHVDACRIGDHAWVIELYWPPDAAHDAQTTARHFVADLTLLGMGPMVYVAAPDALTDRHAAAVAFAG